MEDGLESCTRVSDIFLGDMSVLISRLTLVYWMSVVSI